MPNCLVCDLDTSLWKTCQKCQQQFCFVCVSLDCDTKHPRPSSTTTITSNVLDTSEDSDDEKRTNEPEDDGTIPTEPVIKVTAECVDCKVRLPGYGLRRVCTSCKQIYQRTTDGWAKTGESASTSSKTFGVLYETWQLQDPQTPINPCFVSRVEDLVRVAPRDPPIHPEPTRDYDGFTRAPLLHFIWFGRPKSLTQFQVVFDWASLMRSPWKGICLWLDPDCFTALGNVRWPIIKQAGEVKGLLDDSILTLGSCALPDCVPVYFASIDANLKYLTSQYDFSFKKNISMLCGAIGHERQHKPPFQLAQVASDIMRIIVLRFYGGAYFDFDVQPSMYCKSNGLLEPMHIPLGKSGILCHSKGMLHENDIMFADPYKCEQVLNDMLQWMTKFYKKPESRELYLTQLLGTHLQDRAAGALQKYLLGQTPQPELLVRLAVVVEQDLNRGSKVQFPKVLDSDVATLVSLVNDSVEAATFSCFAAFLGYDPGDKRWDRLKKVFSEETLNKLFYSWKDPGAPKALELIDATVTLQTAIRSYLARKEAERKRQ
jgi:hypothetical protein